MSLCLDSIFQLLVHSLAPVSFEQTWRPCAKSQFRPIRECLSRTFLLWMPDHLYQFPVIAVTNYHKLGDYSSIMHFLTIPEVRSPKWVSRGKNQVASRAKFLWEALGETLFPCLLQPFEPASIPGLMAPSSIFRT